ncbi:AAA family ATPase [Streptomyces sp. NPDC059076]|uniref:AAA family ATPase n=1 Tax=unclassified Streptomyces TaxID=2593676 RepID=UPI0036AEE642
MSEPLKSSVVLITGIMASGKSTVAQSLAERLPRAAHVRGDVFRRMVVSGRAEMGPDLDPEAVAQLRLRYRLAAMTADSYAEAGFTAVLQDVVIGSEFAGYVRLVRTRPLYVVVLAPRPDVVGVREAGRPKSGYGEGWTAESLDAELRERTPRVGLWLDTSEQTPEQTVDEIIARLPEASVSTCP